MPPMPTPRGFVAGAVLDDVIYVAGGTRRASFWVEDLNVVEAFDVITETWSKRAPMPTPRSDIALVAANGCLYAIGGRSGPDGKVQRLNVVERYDPARDEWFTMSPMPTARNAHAAAEYNGKIYVIGGDDGPPNGSHAIATVEVYNPATDSWARAADMPAPKHAMCAICLNGSIFVFSGENGNVWKYDPDTDTWETLMPEVPLVFRYCAAATTGGKIFLAGGFAPSAGFWPAAFTYDPVANSYRRLPAMPTSRAYLAGAAAEGKFFAIGGFVNGTHGTDVVEALPEDVPPVAAHDAYRPK
jgi:N-acetylneuraminic acid mutarotase